MSATCEIELQLNDSYAQAVLLDEPVGYWRLGDAVASGTAADSSGNALHGTVAGGVTFGQVGALAEADTAALFDGIDGKITIAHDALINPASAMTMELWVKPPAKTVNVGYVWMIKNAGGAYWFIRQYEDQINVSIHSANDHYYTPAVWPTGLWTHIAATYDGANLILYINGQPVVDWPDALGISTNIGDLVIGINGVSSPMLGPLDEVAVYDSALSAARIADHYARRTTYTGIDGWVMVLDDGDVRAETPIVCTYGIQGSTPADRVASTGTLSFGLDNSSANSGGVLGYYSPLHASKRPGFDFHVTTRWSLSDGVNTAYKFTGKLADIVVVPGAYDTQIVHCTALDWMDEAATSLLPDLDAQFAQRSDELVTTVLDALPAADQPVARDIETGLETYSIALDGGSTGARPTVREALNHICASELGYFYLKGDASTGGVATFENRHHRATNPSVELALTATEIAPQGLATPGSRDDIYSAVQVFVRPTRIDAAATTVLYSLQTVSALVNAGEATTIWGPYRDPVTNDMIGGTDTVAPVSTTDYLMNASADGLGADLTANFTVVASRTGRGVSFLITNGGGTAGYVTKLQVRGKGIYRYDAMVEATVAGSYGDRVLAVDMIYQNSVNVATDVAHYLAEVYAAPLERVQSVRFLATQSATLLEAAIVREPGDRISVTEPVSGIDHDYTINGVRLEYEHDGSVWCTWNLEMADMQRYWLIGVAGSSEIGSSTVVGF